MGVNRNLFLKNIFPSMQEEVEIKSNLQIFFDFFGK